MHSSKKQKTKVRISVTIKMILTLTLSKYLGWLLSQKTIYGRTIHLVSLNLIKKVDPMIYIYIYCRDYPVFLWSRDLKIAVVKEFTRVKSWNAAYGKFILLS